LATIGSILFAGAEGSAGGIYLSTDNGMNWKMSGLPEIDVTGFATVGTALYAETAVNGVYLSTDSGLHWNSVNQGLPTYGVTGDIEVTSLCASNADLFVGLVNRGIFLSTDKGASWHVTKNNGLPSNSSVSAFAATGSNLFVGFQFGSVIYLSTDNGTSWSGNAMGFGGESVYGFAVDGTNIFVASDQGIFLSTDNATSWTAEGFKDTVVQSLSIVGTNLFAGVPSLGVWHRPLSEMIAPSAIAKATAPEQDIRSYPNPFTQSTRIAFTTNAAGYTDVRVVNLLGTEIAHLFSGTLGAGEHNYDWVPTGLPDGAYECLLRTNGRVQALPVLLAR
ncbi:MAG: WD40/YVTN/BNR-like repeat-containing protein, partial [Rhabdochlamydiaceae bacterium]